MKKKKLVSVRNPELTTLKDNKASWNLPKTRRFGYRNLHKINRYSIFLRSDLILKLNSKPNKTITVLVERKYQHPVLKKVIKARKKYSVHDEENKYKNGDEVSIQECKPHSKSKKFEVIGVSK